MNRQLLVSYALACISIIFFQNCAEGDFNLKDLQSKSDKNQKVCSQDVYQDLDGDGARDLLSASSFSAGFGVVSTQSVQITDSMISDYRKFSDGQSLVALFDRANGELSISELKDDQLKMIYRSLSTGMVAMQSVRVILSETLAGDKLVSVFDGLAIKTIDIHQARDASESQMQSLSSTQSVCLKTAQVGDDNLIQSEIQKLQSRIDQVRYLMDNARDMQLGNVSSSERANIESLLNTAQMLLAQNDIGPARIKIEDAEDDLDRALNTGGGNIILNVSQRLCELNRHESQCTIVAQWSSTEIAQLYVNGSPQGSRRVNGSDSITLGIGTNTIEVRYDSANGDAGNESKTVVVRKVALYQAPAGKVLYETGGNQCFSVLNRSFILTLAASEGYNRCTVVTDKSCDIENEFLLVCDPKSSPVPENENKDLITLADLKRVSRFHYYHGNSIGFVVESGRTTQCLNGQNGNPSYYSYTSANKSEYVYSVNVIDTDGTSGDSNLLNREFSDMSLCTVSAQPTPTPMPTQPDVDDGCYINTSRNKKLYVNGNSQHYCYFKTNSQADFSCGSRGYTNISQATLDALPPADPDCKIPDLRVSASGRRIYVYNITSTTYGYVTGYDGANLKGNRDPNWSISGTTATYTVPSEITGTYEFNFYDEDDRSRSDSVRVSY